MRNEQSGPRSGRAAKGLWLIVLAAMAIYAGSVLAARAYGPGFYWLSAMAVLALGVSSGGWTAKLDEVRRHAHVQAWFWGGLAGLTLAVAGFFTLAATRGGGARTPEEHAFVFGFMFALLPMTLGYIAWWVQFWFRRAA